MASMILQVTTWNDHLSKTPQILEVRHSRRKKPVKMRSLVYLHVTILPKSCALLASVALLPKVDTSTIEAITQTARLSWNRNYAILKVAVEPLRVRSTHIPSSLVHLYFFSPQRSPPLVIVGHK